MNSPFTPLNAATLRAERRATARRWASDAAILALLALITIGTGHALLKTALTVPETLTRAEALKGM